ncbi:MAG: penicillin-binding protein 1A [Gammaproteobacteria bacterium]
MKRSTRIILWLFGIFAGMGVIGAAGLLAAYIILAPGLPSVQALKDVQLQVPLRIYTADGKLMAEYGEKRRSPLPLDKIPPRLQHAFIAAEDARFYVHSGVDFQGMARAVIHLVLTGTKSQGASTITMQVARNFFLSSRKTYTRKMREVFLAWKIEKELTKGQILELYLNKIYLGNRAYGVGAAAHVYYGVNVQDLNLAQMAMIAGLPKAPSRYNPVINPERAKERRNYVLGRMLALGYITQPQYDQAVAAAVTAQLHDPIVEAPAPYVGEMVRADMVQRYGDRAYTDGFKVYTTLKSDLQADAVKALRDDLMDYDMRHGYRGPIEHIDLGDPVDQVRLDELLRKYSVVGGLMAGVVTKVDADHAEVYLGENRTVTLTMDGVAWARPYIDVNHQGPEPKKVTDVLKAGDVIRVMRIKRDPAQQKNTDQQDKSADGKEADAYEWVLREVPDVSGALVSLRPVDGAVQALVGGFDFYHSKFNRALQAERQPGSNFKPFIYSAALAKGYTPASIINDAPVVFQDKSLEETWRPENYSGHFFGPTRLRVGLVHSRNLVSIRLLRAIGVDYAHDYVSRFGFDMSHLPKDLSLALGSGTVTPYRLASAYAIFANGGYRVMPYYIDKIMNGDGDVVFQANPPEACDPPCAAQNAARQADWEKTHAGAAQTADQGGDAPSGQAKPVAEGQGQNPLPQTEISNSGMVERAVGPQPVKPAARVLQATVCYQIVSMMQDVIKQGTGRRALVLHRTDLSGKTGTTNDQKDAWFSGYNKDLVTTVWVGFDKLAPLGNRETGAHAALPMWIEYMGAALKGKPENAMKQPDGMVTVKIDPETGLLANSDDKHAIFETFRANLAPTKYAYRGAEKGEEGQTDQVKRSDIPEQLF